MNQDQTISASEIHTERVGICLDSGISEADAESQGQKERERYIRSLDVRYVLDMPFGERRGYLDRMEAMKGKPYVAAIKSDIQTEWLRKKNAGHC